MGTSGRDLARRAGLSHPRANQVLADLSEQGLVAVQRLPRTDLYRLNQHHALAEPLGKLFELEPKFKLELFSLVARELRSRRLPVKEARIFGSAARGAMAATSDVDLALVTSRDSVAAVEAAAQEIAETARERFGTRLNVLVGSPSLERLSKGPESKQGVWQAIEREGLDVLASSKTAR
jgi:predicted nucleotidyltransferase